MSSDHRTSSAAFHEGENARQPAVETRRLSKTYWVYSHPRDRLKQLLWPGRRRFGAEFHALRSVDLVVYPGETVGVVGRNGSGKSTLLRLICGTLQPSSGTIRVSGNVAPILTIGAGFNPQFTGRENVLLNASVLGMEESEIERRLGAIASFADIGEFFELPVKLYSTGMYSRLAFAVAVHTDPDILVIDETLAVGDEAFARKCFARIEEIKKKGATILFVSHSARHVLELSDRAVLLEQGECLLTGPPKTVVTAYHRLLYAGPANRAEVVRQLMDVDTAKGGECHRGQTTTPPTTDNTLSVHDLERSPGAGRFDPSLVSKSRIEYPNREPSPS